MTYIHTTGIISLLPYNWEQHLEEIHMKTKVPVLTIKAGRAKKYDSVRAAGIALGADGKTVKDKISKLCSLGGGYIGNVYVANGSRY